MYLTQFIPPVVNRPIQTNVTIVRPISVAFPSQLTHPTFTHPTFTHPTLKHSQLEAIKLPTITIKK
jgi:hypothetical protein